MSTTGFARTFWIICLERDQLRPPLHISRSKRGWKNRAKSKSEPDWGSLMKRSNSRRWCEEYRAALQLSPTWYVIYVKLAQLLEQLNQKAEAAQELETLLLYLIMLLPSLRPNGLPTPTLCGRNLAFTK
jgi:hypothetical protein